MSKKKILIFTGAGVSAESGVKTFRDSKDGLWYNFDVSEVASIEGWRKDKSKVLDFYNKRRKEMVDVIPNEAHKIIASLEEHFDVTIVTQNVDDLHERAGSSKIIHLHGELTKARGCLYGNKVSPLDTVIDIGYSDINLGDMCPTTGSQLRPHIVWFGELLDGGDLLSAKKVAMEADACIVVGTSMQVSPANTIPFLTPSKSLIYYIDPGDFENTSGRTLIHIKEVATKGMKYVYKSLMDNLK